MLWEAGRERIVQAQAGPIVRLAAIGDLHIRDGANGQIDALLAGLESRADLLVVAGDITESGRVIEAEAAGEALGQVGLPVVAVLGNHDRRGLRPRAFRQALERNGIRILDGESVTLRLTSGASVGIAGVSGSGGGFWRDEHAAAPHGRAFRAMAIKVRREAERLEQALRELDASLKVAITHYAPTAATLGSEPAAKWWMLGNAELGRVIDRHDVDLVVHGHAHLGAPTGETAGGTPVRNAALPVNGGVVVVTLGQRRSASFGLERERSP